MAAIIADSSLNYAEEFPYNPDTRYPEYLFGELTSRKNDIYENIRRLFLQLGFDENNHGKKNWNPLRKIIKPGNTVILKPNWVNHNNPIDNELSCLITHTSVIRVILDYVVIALNGKGEIIIGDAPIQSCDFEQILIKSRISELVNFLQSKTSVKIRIKDFRKEVMVSKHGIYKRIENKINKPISVNLADDSFLYDIRNDFKKFRVTSYNKERMFTNHNGQDNIYLIDGEILNADAIIEVPKLKTHRKAGISCCLKNSVGINSLKDCLVHHRKGTKNEGGDAYPTRNISQRVQECLNDFYDKTDFWIAQLLFKSLLRLVRLLFFTKRHPSIAAGDWYGNDTLWRMIHDLNKIAFYADSSGFLSGEQQRNILYLVDGIAGGEGEGPLEPTLVKSGILALGTDPLLLDISMAALIGFDYKKIPCLYKALENKLFGYGIDNMQKFNILLDGGITQVNKIVKICDFLPPKGWKEHIEK